MGQLFVDVAERAAPFPLFVNRKFIFLIGEPGWLLLVFVIK